MSTPIRQLHRSRDEEENSDQDSPVKSPALLLSELRAPTPYSWVYYLVYITGGFAFFFTVFYYLLQAYRYDWTEPTNLLFIASAAFVLMTCLISLRLLIMHFNHWYSPSTQIYVVRIIWLLPLYSIESWLALYWRSYAIVFETLRESYEAYVIWNFFRFIVALMGEETHLLTILKSKSNRGTHSFPFNCIFKKWRGYEIIDKCRNGVLIYVVVRNITALITFILAHFDAYDEGVFKFDKGYLYICFCNNIAQLFSLYCLVKFYFILREELRYYKAAGKFICVKGVVFLTWWQSVVIAALANHTDFMKYLQLSKSIGEEGEGVEGSRFSHSITIASTDIKNWWTEDEISVGLQNFLVTFEMLIASIAFSYYFNYDSSVDLTKVSLYEIDDTASQNLLASTSNASHSSPFPLPTTSKDGKVYDHLASSENVSESDAANMALLYSDYRDHSMSADHLYKMDDDKDLVRNTIEMSRTNSKGTSSMDSFDTDPSSLDDKDDSNNGSSQRLDRLTQDISTTEKKKKKKRLRSTKDQGISAFIESSVPNELLSDIRDTATSLFYQNKRGDEEENDNISSEVSVANDTHDARIGQDDVKIGGGYNAADILNNDSIVETDDIDTLKV